MSLRRLDPAFLLNAYSHGIFPMAVENGRIAWFAPDPRAILPLDAFHVPRRLDRLLKQDRFRITLDTDFAGVIAGCAERPEGTWISTEIVEAYSELRRRGFAHSLEVWQEGQLAGGIYGVSLGAAFFGESMFHRVRDASKVALVSLLKRLRDRGYQLFDVQFVTGHLEQFGVITVPRAAFERRLRIALNIDCRFE